MPLIGVRVNVVDQNNETLGAADTLRYHALMAKRVSIEPQTIQDPPMPVVHKAEVPIDGPQFDKAVSRLVQAAALVEACNTTATVFGAGVNTGVTRKIFRNLARRLVEQANRELAGES